MDIRVTLKSRHQQNTVSLQTDGSAHSLEIPAKPSGFGTKANGGELLALALAACYCNDVYREAALRGVSIRGVSVEVDAEFGRAGEPARSIRYRASVEADADPAAIRELLEHTDRVAEIHQTLRRGIDVRFEREP